MLVASNATLRGNFLLNFKKCLQCYGFLCGQYSISVENSMESCYMNVLQAAYFVPTFVSCCKTWTMFTYDVSHRCFLA